jgi:hypothetical protein
MTSPRRPAFASTAGGAADVPNPFHKLGISGLEHFTIPNRLHGHATGGADVSMPLELPRASRHDVMVANRLEVVGVGVASSPQ